MDAKISHVAKCFFCYNFKSMLVPSWVHTVAITGRQACLFYTYTRCSMSALMGIATDQ